MSMHPDDATPPEPGPGEVLSLAEAAAWVGVGHIALRARLDAGDVQLLAGTRRGRALRLVRVCDLRAIFPSVAARHAPMAEWSTEVWPEEEVPGALFAGLSRLGPATGRWAAPRAESDAVRGEEEGAVDVGSEETARYLRQQLGRTRTEVAVTKDENARLKRELLSSADAVKKWLDCVRVDSVRRVSPALNSLASKVDTPRLPAARGDRRSPPAVRVAASKGASPWDSWQHRFTLLGGGLLVVAGLVGGSGIVGGLGLGSTVAALGPQYTPERQAQGKTSRPRWVRAEAPGGERMAETVAPVPVVESDQWEAPEWDGPSNAERLNAGRSDSSHGMEPEEGAPPFVVERSAPPMVVAPGSAILAASMAHPGSQGVEEGCLYFSATRPGMEGRELIGPCQGAWSPRLGAVLASHHRDDHWTCRGHDHFDRALGGSMVRARQLAVVAKAEGLLSPLMSLRVERSAASMLREEVPVWIQSGFESGLLGVGHIVEPLAAAEHWRVNSWVRYVDFAGVEMQRRFRLSLALGDGPRGDVLLSLQWAEE